MFGLSNINRRIQANIRFSAGLIVILVLNFLNSYGQSEPKSRINCVVLDAGHGGNDPGTIGSRYQEKDIALALVLKVGQYIKDNIPDVKVIYTRETDVFIPLDQRAEIANKNQADVFISIHCNANPNKKPFGTETYTMGLTKAADNLEVAKRENSVILIEDNYSSKYQGFDNSPESYIMLSLMQNTHRDQSIQLASSVQNQFREKANRMDRGVKQAGFLVLWQTTMPSILIETGFLSNQDEEKFLASPAGQDYIASAIFRAFRDYKSMIENRSVYILANNALQIDKHDSLPVLPASIVVPDSVSSLPADTTSNSRYYMVQISSSLKPIPLESKLFKGMKNITEYKVAERYKYTVGRIYTYKEIPEYLNNIRKVFPDAFVVGCVDGKIVPAKEVTNQIKALN